MRQIFAKAVISAVALTAISAVAQNYDRMDRNGDGVITRSEWRGDMNEFRDRDWNRDGVLSGDEITGNDSRSNPRYNDSRANDSNRYGEGTRNRSNSGSGAMGKLDKNGSGVVEGYEWPYNARTFHQLDTNGDSVLEQNELQNINQTTLKELDTNHNGRLDDNEWPGGFAQFGKLDQNNDGRVSSDEYLQRGGEWQRRSRFDQWDTNRDGRLTTSEWKSSGSLFRQLDRNRDGVVEWSEYQANTERYDRPFGWRQQ
jgi:Ca2+-binding EF-hand superfamily protein